MKSFEIQNSKKAFSLAEGMVMLIVVSVLMAVAAPLIAKKTQTDAQKFWYKNNANVLGIMGKNQKLGIGTTLTGTADSIPKVTIKSSNNISPIFQVLPGKTNPTNANGFLIYSDGTTNITSRPNFDSGITLPAGEETIFKAPDNGYIYIQNALNSSVSFMKVSATTTPVLDGSLSGIEGDEILLTPTFAGSEITSYPVLIPVYKNGQDIKVSCGTDEICMFFKHYQYWGM